MTFNSMTVHTKFHENLTTNIYYNLSLQITQCDICTGLKITYLYLIPTSQCIYIVPCHLRLTIKLLLALASIVILGSKSHGTHDLTLLSDDSGSLQH
jgi:hypothetical protein